MEGEEALLESWLSQKKASTMYGCRNEVGIEKHVVEKKMGNRELRFFDLTLPSRSNRLKVRL